MGRLGVVVAPKLLLLLLNPGDGPKALVGGFDGYPASVGLSFLLLLLLFFNFPFNAGDESALELDESWFG